MKKFFALLLATVFCLSLGVISVAADETDPFAGMEVMTYEEYMAAEIDAPVIIEAYVQATQSWWNDKITVYLQDKDGAYFVYEMVCSKEDAAKLVPGVKIQVKGYKTEWSGEIEVASGSTFTFVEGADTYIAPAADLTEILGNEAELIKHQNELAIFKDLMIEKIEYKNGEPGDDIYVTVKQGAKSFDFCVERYLTDPNTDVYKAFASLKVGDIVNITGFVYWYKGVNVHITAVESVMTTTTSYADYITAEDDTAVLIESYVQATQSWWSDKITAYLQSEDGAVFVYEMACSKEDAEKLVEGTKIIVYGYKTTWSGEVEVMDPTFVFAEGDDTFKATPADLTSILSNEAELIKHQNELAIFKGLTIENIEYKNGEPGDDIYVTVKQGDKSFSFCVERYLTAPDTDLYKTFATLKAGDNVDITGFVYWYNGVNTHITDVKLNAEEANGTEAPTETGTEANTDGTAVNGCGSTIGLGVIAIAAIAGAGLVSFKKKEN